MNTDIELLRNHWLVDVRFFGPLSGTMFTEGCFQAGKLNQTFVVHGLLGFDLLSSTWQIFNLLTLRW